MPTSRVKGAAAILSAKASASFRLAMIVHGATTEWYSVPAHSKNVTAIRPRGPSVIARITSGLRKALT